MEQITVMADFKLTQLSTSEFKLDSVVDFCLNANGNCMVLIGSSNEVIIFELQYSCDTRVLMPYSIKTIQIYSTGTTQECQEVALDIIYTADCSIEPLKAKVLQADIITKNDTNICCILTTYGYCEIFKKDFITEEWKSLDTNLSNILITEVFPLKNIPSHIKIMADLKTFTNKLIITCFKMSMHVSDLIIYLGTAAGYVIALKYNETSCKFDLYCSLKTALNRLSYITNFNDLILVGCDDGRVILVKINFAKKCLKELQFLWRKPDRMSCRKAIFTYNEDSKSYLVVFCKTAHLLAYYLDMEGAVVSSSTLYVSGIKITGIEAISKNEFIITTVTGAVKHIKVLRPTLEELYFEGHVVDHEFESSNYQILGIGTSLSKNLLSFLLYHNKDYIHQSTYTATTAFVNVCKLNAQDSFEKLINFNSRNMDMAQDLIMAVNLDIFNNMEVNKYMEYLNLEEIKLSNGINDEFLLKLQIKMIITRQLARYQNLKNKKIKAQTKNDLDILEPVLQLLHILGRLRFLKQQHLKKIKFTKFQELSIVCMQLQFSHLLNDIAAINNSDEKIVISSVVKNFLEFFKQEFANNKFDTSNFGELMEYCGMCNQKINNFKKCEQEHDIKRCSISCTQLALFKTKYCPHCLALARNDNEAKLQELYATDDYITCIYCRFLLKHDEFQFICV